MKISFLCSYQGKESGFTDALLNNNDGVLSLCRYIRTGTEYQLVKYGRGPNLNVVIFTNENGKLECIVRGLGRNTNLSLSPWEEENNRKKICYHDILRRE